MSEFDYSSLPKTIDIPEIPAYSLLDNAVAKYPDNIAITFFGIDTTYREFERQVKKTMNMLRSLGIKKGDVVALMTANCPQTLFIYQAVLRVGAIITLINPLYVEGEVEHQIKDSGARIAFVLNILTPKMEPCLKNGLLDKVIVLKLDDYMPWIIGILFNLKLRKEKRYVPEMIDDTHLKWSDLMEAASDEADNETVSSEDIAQYQYTGGTTGVAKGVELTHKNILSNALQGVAWFTEADVGKEVIIITLPIFHVFGLTVGMNMGIGLAARMILVPKFDANEVMKLIAKYKVTLFPGVPMMYNLIINDPKAIAHDTSSVKYCVSGAAPLPKKTKETFEKLTGGVLEEGYGLTEASPLTHCNPLTGGSKTGSIGLNLPNTESKIMAEDSVTEMPQGEMGELAVRGPQVMRGYRGHDEETAMVLKNGWLFTGDMGYIDEDGFIFLGDRKKELIISGGYNVYPRDVEDAMLKLAGVKEVAAIGLPDESKGEIVAVAIVADSEIELTKEAVIAHAKEHLAAYKIPKKVIFVDEIPKTIIGKTLKRILKDQILGTKK